MFQPPPPPALLSKRARCEAATPTVVAFWKCCHGRSPDGIFIGILRSHIPNAPSLPRRGEEMRGGWWCWRGVHFKILFIFIFFTADFSFSFLSQWAGTASWNSCFIINSDSRCFKYQENLSFIFKPKCILIVIISVLVCSLWLLLNPSYFRSFPSNIEWRTRLFGPVQAKPMDYLPTKCLASSSDGGSKLFIPCWHRLSCTDENLRPATTSDKMKPLSDPPEIFLYNGCKILKKGKKKQTLYFSPSFFKKFKKKKRLSALCRRNRACRKLSVCLLLSTLLPRRRVHSGVSLQWDAGIKGR